MCALFLLLAVDVRVLVLQVGDAGLGDVAALTDSHVEESLLGKKLHYFKAPYEIAKAVDAIGESQRKAVLTKICPRGSYQFFYSIMQLNITSKELHKN